MIGRLTIVKYVCVRYLLIDMLMVIDNRVCTPACNTRPPGSFVVFLTYAETHREIDIHRCLYVGPPSSPSETSMNQSTLSQSRPWSHSIPSSKPAPPPSGAPLSHSPNPRSTSTLGMPQGSYGTSAKAVARSHLSTQPHRLPCTRCTVQHHHSIHLQLAILISDSRYDCPSSPLLQNECFKLFGESGLSVAGRPWVLDSLLSKSAGVHLTMPSMEKVWPCQIGLQGSVQARKADFQILKLVGSWCHDCKEITDMVASEKPENEVFVPLAWYLGLLNKH